ncbi:translesion error-prone DNA polymerase V autoproteolytic subunit [Escherichia coli]|uniref:translesion error-prone DNA polymerase V autoproteolytic subunit n=1 Tax=Escherichia coli TaxID=562 RepID=UPI00244E965D|nr:translesion error-prone DNA polymerase V autoproteolytic subunit [Escherichia coli]MDW6328901.1 translesion error-prone DNA polymerase V autoproteolytic subunit [Escherichia coli]
MALDLVYPRPSVEGAALPFFAEPVAAGFPSPAAGYEANELNLHDYCVRRPAATYFLRVSGDSMRDARIHDGDVLVVDRAEEPRHGSIVIASIDNEFTVKQLQLRPYPCLMPLNPAVIRISVVFLYFLQHGCGSSYATFCFSVAAK